MNVGLEVRWIGRRSCHDDFDLSLVEIVAVPLGAQFHNLLIQLDRDPAAHRDNHGLARHRSTAFFPMGNDVCSHSADPGLSTDQSFELGPLRLGALRRIERITFTGLFNQIINVG